MRWKNRSLWARGKSRLVGTIFRHSLARNGNATEAACAPVITRTMGAPDQVDDSLKTLSNLLYLLRRSLDDPAKATKYHDLADQLLVDIAASHRLHPVHSPGH
jgi:hypothetical protein